MGEFISILAILLLLLLLLDVGVSAVIASRSNDACASSTRDTQSSSDHNLFVPTTPLSYSFDLRRAFAFRSNCIRMDKTTPKRSDDSECVSLVDLLRKYTKRIDERETLWKEGTRACREQQKGRRDQRSLYSSFLSFSVQTNEIQRLKESLNKCQLPRQSLPNPSPSTRSLNGEPLDLNYKKRCEEAEAKCRLWEEKYHQLESRTKKESQEKTQQLQHETQRVKVCNQLTLVERRGVERCCFYFLGR